MPLSYISAFLSVSVVSLISLIGVLILFFNENAIKKLSFVLVSLAIGSMFGDVAWHLLPEAFSSSSEYVSLALISGIIIFFIIEKILHWQHEHEPSHKHIIGRMNIVGDSVHNLMDGIIIGSTYLVDPTVGFATTIAVVLHEIPQEISDFGVLIHSGFSRKKALLFNLFSAVIAFVGLGIALWLGNVVHEFTPIMLAFTAGGFIYIAGSDLIPELHRDRKKRDTLFELLGIVVGIIAMFSLTLLGK